MEEEEEEELCNLWVKQAQSRCISNLAEKIWTSKPRVAYFWKDTDTTHITPQIPKPSTPTLNPSMIDWYFTLPRINLQSQVADRKPLKHYDK